jgi:uncharacterized membrane protein YqiK
MIVNYGYDKGLNSIDLITAAGDEPVLLLSLVLYIDYEKEPSIIQRFGDAKRLISQTLDTILPAYFRSVAQPSNMLDLLTWHELNNVKSAANTARPTGNQQGVTVANCWSFV